MASHHISSTLTPELEQILGSCTNLPSLPSVALKILDASKNPDIGLHEVSAIISSDPAIAAKLLKIANSSLYSQRRTVSNLREALTLLGLNAALTIGLSFSLPQALLAGKNSNTANYWKRSILAAAIARLLGVRLHVLRLEDLFLTSLVQDIGILVIEGIKQSPYPGDDNGNLKHTDRIVLENNTFDADHSLIGAWLLESWQLPENLVNAVRFSHSLNIIETKKNKADDNFHYCLNLSGSLADIWLEDNPGELLLSILGVAKETLQVDNKEFHQLIVDIDNLLPEISSLFEISLIGEKERERVICEARELLLDKSLYLIKQSDEDRRHIDSITERVEKIEKSSRLDHLTKTYNRQYIEQLLCVEYNEANINRWPLSVAFIDIDNFKSVNDTYGHLAGDEVLHSVADFFAKNIRQTDVLARYGGDEFILMLPGSTSDIAQEMLQRLLELFHETVVVEVNGELLQITITVGLATHQEKHIFSDIKELINAADDALYKMKATGKKGLSVY
jgi:diguanylate cyclase (GGDEF)-like protein